MLKYLFFILPLYSFSQVGINTNNPIATLDVEGTSRITNLPNGDPVTNRKLGVNQDRILVEYPRSANGFINLTLKIPEVHTYAKAKLLTSSTIFPSNFTGFSGEYIHHKLDTNNQTYIPTTYYIKYEVTNVIIGGIDSTPAVGNAIKFPVSETLYNNNSTVMSIKYSFYRDPAFTISSPLPVEPKFVFMSCRQDVDMTNPTNINVLLQSTVKSIDYTAGTIEFNITRADNIIVGWKKDSFLDVMIIEKL